MRRRLVEVDLKDRIESARLRNHGSAAASAASYNAGKASDATSQQSLMETMSRPPASYSAKITSRRRHCRACESAWQREFVEVAPPRFTSYRASRPDAAPLDRASENLTVRRELTPHQTRGQRVACACPQSHHLGRMGHCGVGPYYGRRDSCRSVAQAGNLCVSNTEHRAQSSNASHRSILITKRQIRMLRFARLGFEFRRNGKRARRRQVFG